MTSPSTLRNLKKEQTKPTQVEGKNKTIKIREEGNEIESIKIIKKIQSWFLVKINSIDKCLPRLNKKIKNTQMTQIRMTEHHYWFYRHKVAFKRILYNKLGNLDKMDTFLEKHKLPKLSQEVE